MKFIILNFLILLLAACGENNSTPNTTIIEPSTPIVNNAINAFDDVISANQAVELFLVYPKTQLSNIEWIQTSGTPVTLLTPNNKGIAFTPEIEGIYSFQASFNTKDGRSEVLRHNIEVTNNISRISVRLGHVVSEGNKVSLRTQLAPELNTNTIKWQQTSGPVVSFTNENTSGSTSVFFDAPEVKQDTIITFEVSATHNNESFHDTVALLIENKEEIANNAIFEERVSDTFSYNENSPYKDHLTRCVYSNQITINSICTLNTLPLVAHDTLTPTVNDIMNRVIVSHKWMGDRFKTFLEQYDTHNDLKNMLRATTAIVISYDIRPSFYWGATGAIYLDANNFWLTPQERDTLNEAPDYRSEFGKALQFAMPWRYVKNNNYLSTFISADTRRTRELDNGAYQVIGLLYHELAHANDFFPESYWLNVNRNQKVLNAIPNTIQSDLLNQAHPLLGNEMLNLAQVSFHGASATNTQKSYLPSDITQLFSVEASPQYYNYSSVREDYAMLFDGFMMKARYDIDRDVAVTNQVSSNGASSDYIVNWGQRGRIGDSKVKQRLSFVIERVLPEFEDYQRVINNLPMPIAMQAGKSWIENLAISTNSSPTNTLEGLLKPIGKQQVSANVQTNNNNRPINEFTLLFEEKALPIK